MTIPSFTGLQTALRGLTAAQAQIDTTSHNIANANTPGYTRQQVDLTQSPSMTLTGLSIGPSDGVQLGTGVDVSQISRVRDQFLDIQYRAQNSNTSNASTQTTVLNQVQTALDEPSSNGLSTQLQKFWSSWNDLSNSTSGTSAPAARQSVVDAGTTVAQSLNALDAQLATVQSQAAQQYQTLTASPTGVIQTDANQIAQLNGQISQMQAAGISANDLLDQRDQLLDSLSGMANISVTDQGNGMVQVTLGDAASPLVSGTTVTWPQTLTAAAGGQLGALIGLSDTTSGQIQTYRNQLDTIASQLVSSVNSLQPSSPFFSGTSAATIAVTATPSSIQTSSTSDPTGNDLAIQISRLANGTADQSYASFVAKVGNDTAAAQGTQSTGNSLLQAINGQRQSVSGVSLDEEMTNLITFQRAYQASARVMNAIDTTLDTLINQVGAH
ncbi:MAG: flagellar hook-associated protein FlgK [Solirubrobacteraceae bacterium]